MIDRHGNYTADEIAYKDRGGPEGEYAKLCKYCTKLAMEYERERMTKNNGTPGIYKDADFHSFRADTPEQEKAKTAVMQYAHALPKVLSGEPGKYNLILSGSVGTGKTLLAAAVINDLSMRCIRAKFVSFGTILRDIKDSFKSNEVTEKDILAEYKAAKVLAIDDLGKERSSKWANSLLFEVIDYRYTHGLATIITTNHSRNELTERLIPFDDPRDKTQAQAIMSRLLCRATAVKMNWQDYRLKEDF